jgi:ribokinase
MKLSSDVLKLPSIFCVNELESEEMTGVVINQISDAKRSIQELTKKGCQMVILTLGSLGAAFNEGSKFYHVPVPSTVSCFTVTDTVGAGDAFIGGLANFIAKFPASTWIQKIGASMEIATHSVQFKGTQTSYINFPSIDPKTRNYQFEEIL